MKKQKIDFSKLLGSHYPLEVKMMVLDWMLKTGKKHRQRSGRWNVIGISQFLFDYSGNDYDSEISIPKKSWNYSNFFDSIFARAIFKEPNKSINEWRNTESINPKKCRMLDFEESYGYNEKHPYLSWLLASFFELIGSELKKEFAHPDYIERTVPKIISIKIFTTGNGWIVRYVFSFSEFDYEPGWSKSFHQNESQSISAFFQEAYEDITTRFLLVSETIEC